MGFFEASEIFGFDNPVESDHGQSAKSASNYEDPEEVANLIAWHLARIFRATFRKKVEREIEKLKQDREVELNR